MQYWKEHPAIRVLAITALFLSSAALILAGFRMTGQLAGLGLMVLGVLALTAALAVYNSPSRTPKKRK